MAKVATNEYIVLGRRTLMKTPKAASQASERATNNNPLTRPPVFPSQAKARTEMTIHTALTTPKTRRVMPTRERIFEATYS